MKISILGCGWLGLPLAEHLIRRGHVVKGSTTTKDKLPILKSRSIEPFLLWLDPELSAESKVDNFFQSHVLVLNIPPARSRENTVTYHRRQVQTVIAKIAHSPIRQVVFVSSTSVYPKYPGLVTENDAIPGKAARASGNALLQAERLLFKTAYFKTTVLRFGGLMGGNRHPVKYLAGKENLARAGAPVNLIHRDDCIQIITHIIEEHITGEIYNAVADEHPVRKDYYIKAAQRRGLKPPTFAPDESNHNYKVVSNKKLKNELSFFSTFRVDLGANEE